MFVRCLLGRFQTGQEQVLKINANVVEDVYL